MECEDYCGVTQLNVQGQLPPEAGWLFQKQNNEGPKLLLSLWLPSGCLAHPVLCVTLEYTNQLALCRDMQRRI